MKCETEQFYKDLQQITSSTVTSSKYEFRSFATYWSSSQKLKLKIGFEMNSEMEL